jgi:hypothetical protein
MPDRVLQNHNCVAALQRRLLYNVVMSLRTSQHGDGPASARAEPMISQTAAAIAPVLAAAAPRVRHSHVSIHINGLFILLVIVLVIVGVVWARRRSRTGQNVPDRPDEWPPRHPERKPEDENEDPPPWQ